MNALESFARLSRPHFGQAVTWLLLYIVLAFTPAVWPIPTGERIGPATVLSVLPTKVLSQPLLFAVLQWTLKISAILWACRLLIPWSCWMTALAFTAVVSFCHENSSVMSRTSNISNMLLIIHAMWYHFYRREIATSFSAGTFWNTSLYPQWAFSLSVFYIGLYYTYAGVTKLATSGLDWANGLSLQLWVYLWGVSDSPLREVILSNRTIAKIFQIMTLTVESSAILALLCPRVRLFIGISLLGFHFGIFNLLGYRFPYNVLWIAVFFLPIDRFAQVVYARIRPWLRSKSLRLPKHFFGRLAMAVMLLIVFRTGTAPRYPEHVGRTPGELLILMVCFVCLVCLEGAFAGDQKGLQQSLGTRMGEPSVSNTAPQGEIEGRAS
jgi:hypothetical protein